MLFEKTPNPENPLEKVEAAPRVELGIRVLQTPALPLGDAATTFSKNAHAKVSQSA